MSRKSWSILLTIVLGVLCFQRILLYDFKDPVFIDEVENVQSAVNLFRYGLYSPKGSVAPLEPHGFEISVTSGIASTWAPAVGFIAFKTLSATRIAFGLLNLAMLILAGWWVLRRWFAFLAPWAVPASLATFFLAITLVPYMHVLSVQTLGEITGACLIASGFAWIKDRPRLAALLWGTAIWHAKFIYLPYALLGIGYQALFRAQERGSKGMAYWGQVLSTFFKQLGWVMLPIVVLNLWIVLRSGFSGWWLYITSQLGVFGTLGKSYSSLDPALAARPHGLSARLASPLLEWATYAPVDRYRILFLFFVPMAVLAFVVVRRRLRKAQDLPLDLFQVGLICAQAVFAYWYFFIHTNMWIRHITPALFIGLGVLLYFALSWIATIPARKQAWILGGVLLVLVAKDLRKLPETAAMLGDPAYKSRPSVCGVSSPWTALNNDWLHGCQLDSWMMKEPN